MKRRTRIPGVHGGGQNGPPEADGRYAVAGTAKQDRREFCNHTGQDYWPRPCDACIARSESTRASATN